MLPSALKKRSPREIPVRRSVIVAAMLAVAALIAGCGSNSDGSSSAGPTASTAANTTNAALTLRSSEYGKVVSDARHRVLYMFAADHGPTSTCYGECAKAWPPLLAKDTPTADKGLNAELLGTTKRKDGSDQVTYDGHPLYYYVGDRGEHIMCQRAKMHGGFWYVVNADGTANMAEGQGTMSMGHEEGMDHETDMKSP